MRIHISLVVLGLCVLIVAAKPGGSRGGGRKKGKPGHENPPPMTPDEGETPGETPGGRGKPSKSGRKPGRDGRPGGHGRPDHERPVDPVCETLDCEKPTRDTIVCGTDGQTYRSECFLIRDRCKGKITADVEVASQGRCQHPAEAGEPQGHRGPGKRTRPGHGKRPGGRTPKGDKDRRRPSKGKWPKECWGLIPTMAPEIDYVTGAEPEGPVCTATCPAATPENPLQTVCGTNGRTYESECVLELVACVTNNSELLVSSEGPCQ